MMEISGENGWVYDAPTGTYKNRKLSAQIVETGVKTCPLITLAQVRQLGDIKGTKATIPTVVRLEKVEPLEEGETVPSTPPTTLTLNLQEWGQAVPYTSLSEDLTTFDPDKPVINTLIRCVGSLHSNMLAGGLRSTHQKCIPGYRKKNERYLHTFLANDLNDLTEPIFDPLGQYGWLGSLLGKRNKRRVYATRSVSAKDLLKARDMLSDQEVSPQVEKSYTLVASCSGALHHILSDPEFEFWQSYKARGDRLPGEKGRWKGITVLVDGSIRGYQGTGNEAFLVAGHPLCVVISLDLEARVMIPTDFGRRKCVAMYGLMACGLLSLDEGVIHFCGAIRPDSVVIRADRAVRAVSRRMYYKAKSPAMRIKWSLIRWWKKGDYDADL